MPRLKLYWCWTEDHDEDWFVVARRAQEARRFFERYEGYGRGDASAAFVAVLPENLQNDEYNEWPSLEVLTGCGARILRWETPRVVELCGRRYAEGMLEQQILELTDDHAERSGRGRPNQTRRSPTQ